MLKLVAGIAFVSLAFVGGPAWAETASFKADLKGSEEVPPTTSAGAGSVEATYDSASKQLTWKGTVSALSGPATAAHFHGPAGPGQNAGVLIPVPGVKTGPFEGSATLNDKQSKALLAGQTYFNVHTAANPNGELRGQVVNAK